MLDFKNYLTEKSYSNSTITETVSNVKQFLAYCTTSDISPESVSFQTVLSFIDALQGRGVKPQSVNARLVNIRKYYDYLKHYGYVAVNPINRVKQRGGGVQPSLNLLTAEQLRGIYNSYAQPRTYSDAKQQYTHIRNTVVLGFIVFQGLHAGNLKVMDLNDIDMSNAAVFIRSGRRSNERYLSIEAAQIVHLYQYLNEARPKASTLQSPSFGGVGEVASALQSLPFGEVGGVVIGNVQLIHDTIIHEVRGANSSVSTAGQLRKSVIANWIKQKGKRQAQYLSGHKCISSTERYHVQDLQAFSNLVKSFHPFG